MAESAFVSTTGLSGSAVIIGRYRYSLSRSWADGGATCLFVMLNPSTADAFVDDPTLKSCVRLAKAWGFDRLVVGNLYAWRSPKPADLLTAPEPVGPENDDCLDELVVEASQVVVAWGAGVADSPSGWERARAVCERLVDDGDRRLWCPGTTAAGHPAHPLYLPNDTELERFDHWRELYG